MTNIALTSQCNRSCSTCFTGTAFPRANGAVIMDRPTFIRALDFVDRSKMDEIRLLGGEPTLHPEFISLLELALQREKMVRVFSNGALPDPMARFIENLPQEQITFVVNLSAWNNTPAADHGALMHVLERLGSRAMAAINISRPFVGFFRPTDDPVESLLQLVESIDMQRTIRVGVTHPCLEFDNDHVHANEYAAVGRALLELARRGLERGITLNLDCGVVPCMAPELLDSSFGQASRQLRGLCGPVLDILPDGRIIPCFPLAGLFCESLDDESDAAATRTRFDSRLANYRQLGVFRFCEACRIRRDGGCSGGCIAAAMKRLRTPVFPMRDKAEE